MLNIRLIRALALASFVVITGGCAHKGAPAPETSAASAQPAESKIATSGLGYQTDSTKLEGFLAYPEDATDKQPGVLVVHEWWGLNEYARTRARQLAELGYVALAVDMYGAGRNSDHPEDAKKMMTELVSNREEAAKRFQAARAALAADPHVDPTKIAAIGYCLGGAVVLEMARQGADLAAVASFHGNYATKTPLEPGKFPGKILIAHGAADSFVTPEMVTSVQDELNNAKADYEFVSYPGAKHGFTNPGADDMARRTGMDIGYDAAADAQSWQKLQEVLKSAFAAR